MPERDPVYWSIRELRRAYRDGTLSPVEVVESTVRRIEDIDDRIHAYLTITAELARDQAARAAEAYRGGSDSPALLGIPTAVKDAFYLRDVQTTLGSLVHRGSIAAHDSGVVRRLRAAGAVFTGKTNTSEFGQSATTDNLLGPDTANPWDLSRTPGGSSGGSAAAVAAGMANVAVGSDGGGSVRIPASFCGLVGVKPTPGLCPDEDGLRAMTAFVSPGPLTRRVDDARIMLGVLADRHYERTSTPRGLRIAWCPRPEGHPVAPEVVAAAEHVAGTLDELGHDVRQREVPLSGWLDIFGPLVLDDEHRERGHLLPDDASVLTAYERKSLSAAREMDPATVEAARCELTRYRTRMANFFDEVDLVLTPATAVPAFPLGHRPRSVAGERVSSMWGAFPFTAPFNVAGTPAVTLPCGRVDGLPVAVQLAAAPHREQVLLDLAEEVETALDFDPSAAAHDMPPTSEVGA